MSIQLIIALDFNTEADALSLVDRINPRHCALKVGSELFTLLGTQFVRQLIQRHFNVFLDLKFHDIPNTVSKACKIGADLGVWMMNVHASGGQPMMHAARKALDEYGTNRPLLIAVTILTSFNQSQLTSIGVNLPLIEQVKKLALLTHESGLDGVVCSAEEAKLIKNSCGPQFITVTPGIRPQSSPKDDQKRVMTPKQAIENGSDYLVIGRPITQAADPEKVIREILNNLQT